MSDEEVLDPVVTLPIPESIIEELEVLRPLVRQLPEWHERPVTRLDMVQLAVAHGLERIRLILKARLEQELHTSALEPGTHPLIDGVGE